MDEDSPPASIDRLRRMEQLERAGALSPRQMLEATGITWEEAGRVMRSQQQRHRASFFGAPYRGRN